MNVSLQSPSRFGPSRLGVAIGCLLLAACASPSIGNAPPAVVDECQREVAAMTDREEGLTAPDEPLREVPGSTADPIDKARVAREELEGSGLAAWPEDALLYRCFTSRGVVLTEEQASVLAEWQGRTDPGTPEPR